MFYSSPTKFMTSHGCVENTLNAYLCSQNSESSLADGTLRIDTSLMSDLVMEVSHQEVCDVIAAWDDERVLLLCVKWGYMFESTSNCRRPSSSTYGFSFFRGLSSLLKYSLAAKQENSLLYVSLCTHVMMSISTSASSSTVWGSVQTCKPVIPISTILWDWMIYLRNAKAWTKDFQEKCLKRWDLRVGGRTEKVVACECNSGSQFGSSRLYWSSSKIGSPSGTDMNGGPVS